jgi:hypothetical protein
MGAVSRGQAVNRLVGLVGAAGTGSHRQTPPRMAMDYRVISDHTPFTPFPLPWRGAECS